MVAAEVGRATRELLVHFMGKRPYEPAWRAMRDFTATRHMDTPDEFWLVEHPPVFTVGQAGHREHLLAPGGIPVISTDRGGQVTYHGPGQVVLYTLIDLRRKDIGIRALVSAQEQAVIDLLAKYGINARSRQEAPGVYVGPAKIAALGLRVRQGRSYHGLALNVDMDLEPFRRINPCGYQGLQITQLADLDIRLSWFEAALMLSRYLADELGYPCPEPLKQVVMP